MSKLNHWFIRLNDDTNHIHIIEFINEHDECSYYDGDGDGDGDTNGSYSDSNGSGYGAGFNIDDGHSIEHYKNNFSKGYDDSFGYGDSSGRPW